MRTGCQSDDRRERSCSSARCDFFDDVSESLCKTFERKIALGAPSGRRSHCLHEIGTPNISLNRLGQLVRPVSVDNEPRDSVLDDFGKTAARRTYDGAAESIRFKCRHSKWLFEATGYDAHVDSSKNIGLVVQEAAPFDLIQKVELGNARLEGLDIGGSPGAEDTQ